uniref:Bestrophin homolog n=1 Tax=Steinernema glaseri TaxID=37863 RepID=A0A1I7Z1R1_9BILA
MKSLNGVSASDRTIGISVSFLDRFTRGKNYDLIDFLLELPMVIDHEFVRTTAAYLDKKGYMGGWIAIVHSYPPIWLLILLPTAISLNISEDQAPY